MNDHKQAPAWLTGASIGIGAGIGGAIGRGAGDTFAMKIIIGAAAAVAITLAAQLILSKFFARRRE